MNVLSLFDGMSCGQIALRELGMPVGRYYASEVDRHAIAQTQLNFPDTVQLGDVRGVDVAALPHIDLLIGGSPCQSFSFAGKRNGMTTMAKEEVYTLDRYMELKRQGFEFEGQSYLFWEYMRILTEIRQYNPGVLFLLENVEMEKRWEGVLSEAIGVLGVHINSALVSAQNRRRIYWTNIRTRQEGLFGDLVSDIPQPQDRGLLLRDILEGEVAEKYYLSDAMMAWIKSLQGTSFSPSIDPERAGCITTGNASSKMQMSRNTTLLSDGKTNALTTVQKDNMVAERIAGVAVTERGIRPYKADGGSLSEIGTAAFDDQKSDTLTTKPSRMVAEREPHKPAPTIEGRRLRRLTPTECARLQTIPEWYRWQCSETQQYKMLGNGWTVEVVKHILSFIDPATIEENRKKKAI